MTTEATALDLGHAVALLAAAVVAVPLFRRLGLGAVLGYLSAGLLIGPFGLALFHEPESILHVAELGVVLFRRDGWGREEWAAWAAALLRDQVAFVAPTTYRGEPMGRLVFMHPRTPETIVDELMDSLR